MGRGALSLRAWARDRGPCFGGWQESAALSCGGLGRGGVFGRRLWKVPALPRRRRAVLRGRRDDDLQCGFAGKENDLRRVLFANRRARKVRIEDSKRIAAGTSGA